MKRSDEARREDGLYDRLSQVRQSNRKLEAENKALRKSFEQEVVRLLNVIEQLKTENEKFKTALQNISNTEDSRKAAGAGFDVTINVIAKIALGEI